MGKSKIDFIVDLLENENISSSQKEKLFALTAIEIKSFSETELKILKEIEIIKEKIGLSDKLPEKPKNPSKPNFLPEYKNPRSTASFLLEYNQNIFLKSTTHNIDSNLLAAINEQLKVKEYDFKLHQSAIQNAYVELKNKHFTIKGLVGKIDGYIWGKVPWSEEEIAMSWSSNELEEWCAANPKQCPNPEIDDLNHKPFNFQKIKLKNGLSIKNFNELVLYFKKQLTIRSDNSILDLCKKWNFQFKEVVSFNLESVPTNIEFFTDVEKLAQVYVKTIRMCINSSLGIKPEIKLNLQERKNISGETEIVFSIHHINSKFQRSKESLTRYGTDFTGIISNQLNGLCNWELVADFDKDVYGSIYLWPKSDNFSPSEKLEGVKFNLIFYR